MTIINRRSALYKIIFWGGLGVFSFSGYNLFRYYGMPNLSIIEKNRPLIASLANTIIPETESPGASSVNVGDFIIKMLNNCTPRNTLNNFLQGLDSIENFCYANYYTSFANCTAEQKLEVLNKFENKQKRRGGIVGKIQKKILGNSFISILKEYTIKGYCTSKLGATQGLAYNSIPGKYIGCLNLKKNQKAWATS
jgi:glucoside 3-dehydrogenase (cytochrome c) hitch-hiker subunit